MGEQGGILQILLELHVIFYPLGSLCGSCMMWKDVSVVSKKTNLHRINGEAPFFLPMHPSKCIQCLVASFRVVFSSSICFCS